MKVLMISKTMMVEAYHAPLFKLSELGVELTVVAPPKWGTQRIEGVAPAGYEMLVMKSWLAGAGLKRHANHLHFYPGISQVIHRQNWDLVHIDEEPFNFVTYHAMRSLNGDNTPVIFTTWQNLMKRYPPPFSLFESRVFSRSCGAIAGNSETLEVLQRRGFNKPTAVISHGIDPEIFRRQDANALRRKLGLNGSFVVGYMGRLVPEKGLDILIRAMATLPDDSLLVLMGSGPCRNELDALARNLGMEKRVLWVPWVDSGEVPAYMNAFDVLALPSRTTRRWKEQFGRVLIEAMACETCVVGSDSGEIPATIGEGGLIFPEGNDRELAERLRTLMGDSALRARLGRSGRERVIQHYTHERIARDTASFYEQVCRG